MTSPALDLLTRSVEQLLDSGVYREALAFRTRFHQYSFRNAWLIYQQRPDATLVTGYRAWQAAGRQVRRGERGIAILAPTVRTLEENGEKVKRVTGFRTVHVFDLAQTEGEAVPVPPRPRLLTDDSTHIRDTLLRLERYAWSRDIEVTRDALRGRALGRYLPATNTITLRRGLAPLQELKTLAHEVMHALMHREDDRPRHLCELEAESGAFLLCDALGLDTSAYTFAYLAGWAGDATEILPAAERAHRAAQDVLAALTPTFETDRVSTGSPARTR